MHEQYESTAATICGYGQGAEHPAREMEWPGFNVMPESPACLGA